MQTAADLILDPASEVVQSALVKLSKTPAPCPTGSHVIVTRSSCLRSLIVFLEHCVPQWVLWQIKVGKALGTRQLILSLIPILGSISPP